VQPTKNRNNKKEIHERIRLIPFAFERPCNEHAAEKTRNDQPINAYKMPSTFNHSNKKNGNVKNKKRVINDTTPKYFISIEIIFNFKKYLIKFIVNLPIVA